MKRVILVVVLTLFACTVFAKRKSGSVCDPRVPIVNMTKAIGIANKYLISRGFDLNEQFIDYIELKCENKIHFWVVGYRVRKNETGHFLVFVYMDNSTKSTVVKDG